MADSFSRDASTFYAVGSRSMAGRGPVFTDYFLPGGKRVRVMDRDVFDAAVRKSSEVLTEFAREFRDIGKASDRAK